MVSPFGVHLARIYAAASVPEEILEAARIDGSSDVRTVFVVSIRLMALALVTIFPFQYPVTFGLYTWNGLVTQAPEMQMLVIVGSLVSIVPLIAAFLSLTVLAQRVGRRAPPSSRPANRLELHRDAISAALRV